MVSPNSQPGKVSKIELIIYKYYLVKKLNYEG